MKPKKFFVLLAITAFPSFCFAQSSPQLKTIQEYALHNMPRFYDSTLKFINLKPNGNLNYLYPLYQLFKEEPKFKQMTSDIVYNNEMSEAASFLEDYQTVLEYHKKNYEALDAESEKKIRKVIDDLKDIINASAEKYISFAAKDRQVIMINEAYDKPLHRAFTLSLLEDLYKKGFRYLAMETLYNVPDASLDRLTSATGYFTSEPIGGELVRRALELGYKLVPYEDAPSLRNSNQRDSARAANIYKIIQQDPSAKILVEASYGHIAKTSHDNGYVPMGMAFKKMSGIDPLCIDQVSMSDEGEFFYGKALYDAYTDKFSISIPSVALLDGQAINITNNDGYDVCVIHPHTTYKDNRPVWLSLGGLRKLTYVKATVAKTFLVQAYYDYETNLNGPGKVVPADQTYINTNNDNYALYLRKGKYLVTFRDVGYHLIGKLNIEVN